MRIIAVVLLFAATLLTIDGAIFYGTPLWWSLVVGVFMFLGPVLILIKYRQGVYIAFFISFYLAVASLSLLDGSSLMEIEVATNIQSPTNVSIYVTISLSLLYILLSGIITLKCKSCKSL